MSSTLRQLPFEQSAQEPILFKTGNGSKSTATKRDELFRKYVASLYVNPALNRPLVSFQANKSTPFYRWFKYSEGFLSQFKPHSQDHARILDPFAGAGTTLTTATKEGWHATGIELLPVGASAIRARVLADTVNVSLFQTQLDRLASFALNETSAKGYQFPHVRITEKAFPKETEQALSAFMAFLETIHDADVRYLELVS